MASQGRSIEATVDLNIEPFTSKIGELQGELKKLSEGLKFDTATLESMREHFQVLENMMGKVVAQAKEINTAFENIKGIQTLLNNLRQVEAHINKINSQTVETGNLIRKEATDYSKVGMEIIRNGNEIKKNLTYEEEMLATEKLFQNGLAEEMRLYAEQVQLQEQIRAINESDMAIRKGIATNVKEILAMSDEQLAVLREEIALEERKLGVISEETAMLNEQGAVRQRNVTKGNQLDKASYLPARIGSMAVTMWGFNEIMDIYDKAMQNLNAYGSQKTYADLMRNDTRYLTQTKQDVNDINTGIKELNKSLNETYKGGMSLQRMYQKVDMQSVGANAMDTAFKYGVQAENLDELAEVMAIYGSEFVRQGRSQEDSILAVNDALDGEIRRLKEVGIDREDLEAKGWKEGDTMSMITALREIAEERGYDVVAQKVTNLSDAITVLEIRIAQDLVGAFRSLEPFLTEVANDFIFLIGKLEEAWVGLSEIGKGLKGILDDTFGKDNVNNFGSGLLWVTGWVVTLGLSFAILYKIASAIASPINKLLGLGKEAEDIGGSLAKDTGGIAKTGSDVGFKEGFKQEWAKLGRDLGKIARAFVDMAVIMFGAFLLIEEGILLISTIGATYEALKPQFESGIEFIKEFGVTFALLGVALLGLSFIVDKIPSSAIEGITKGATKLAYGMAIAMGLVAEAIVLLNAPLLAIASIGAIANWQKGNIDSGVATIRMFGDALNYIASDDTIGWFIIGFVALSGILGFTADVVAVPLAVGIATSLLLVAEAITMLIVPLGAIALLGASASALGEENINQGAEAIRMIGRVLKVLSDAMVDLFVVDIATLGVMLTEKATQLITGKTGLEALTDEIIPSLTDFIKRFNGLDMGEPVDQSKVQAIIQMSNDIPPLFNAMQTLNNALGTANLLGNIGGAIGGGISGMIGMGLKSKLDQLYNDAKDVMDFATKMGSLSGGGKSGNASAITQTANAIGQLKAKLDLMISTVSGASSRLRSASTQLGRALTDGFKTGSSTFNTTITTVLSQGIQAIQSRYGTFQSGGRTLGQKLSKGFESGADLQKTTNKELGYALQVLENRRSDFYNKGKSLGEELSRGYEDGVDMHSPGRLARTTASEMGFIMEALDNGRQLMYNGGKALGSALATGYAESNANLRTNVDVLASKGISNEQLQATARTVQANTNNKGQTQQSLTPIINIDMSNSTIIGVQDLDARIKASIDRAFVEYNSPNGAVGY